MCPSVVAPWLALHLLPGTAEKMSEHGRFALYSYGGQRDGNSRHVFTENLMYGGRHTMPYRVLRPSSVLGHSRKGMQIGAVLASLFISDQ